MRYGITGGTVAVAVALLVGTGTAHAQQPVGKVIDTSNLVVKPVTTSTNIFAQSAQYVSRVVSGMIDNNAIIRTVNNLFGNQPKAAPIQGGLSPLPDPKLYPSTYYRSPIQPAMPIYPKR
ncbi:MAG: hypothetical protein MUF18_07350 [Fimbriiglobus sp.]|jgi:hypothetical protein|nr:hypothetical protein [Fimbriiglobus sp.]